MHSLSSDCIAFGRKPISAISSITASVSGGESGWLIACIMRAICSGSMPVPAGSWPPPGIIDCIRAIISSEPAAPRPMPGRPGIPGRPPGIPGIAMPPGICGIAMPPGKAMPGAAAACLRAGRASTSRAACRASRRRRAASAAAAAEQAHHPAGAAAGALAQVERLQRVGDRDALAAHAVQGGEHHVLEHRLGGVLDDLLDHQQQHRRRSPRSAPGRAPASRRASRAATRATFFSCAALLDLRSRPGATRPGPAGSGWPDCDRERTRGTPRDRRGRGRFDPAPRGVEDRGGGGGIAAALERGQPDARRCRGRRARARATGRAPRAHASPPPPRRPQARAARAAQTSASMRTPMHVQAAGFARDLQRAARRRPRAPAARAASRAACAADGVAGRVDDEGVGDGCSASAAASRWPCASADRATSRWVRAWNIGGPDVDRRATGELLLAARRLAEVEPEMGEADVRGGRDHLGTYSPRIAQAGLAASAAPRRSGRGRAACCRSAPARTGRRCAAPGTAPSGASASRSGSQRRARPCRRRAGSKPRFDEHAPARSLRSPSARVSEITWPSAACASTWRLLGVEQDAEVGVVLDLAAPVAEARAGAASTARTASAPSSRPVLDEEAVGERRDEVDVQLVGGRGRTRRRSPPGRCAPRPRRRRRRSAGRSVSARAKWA